MAGGLERSAQGSPWPRERDAFLFALSEIGATVYRRRLWLALAVALCLGLAGAASVVRKPEFVSTAQVLLDPRGLNVTDNEVVPRPPSADVNDAIIETQIRLLNSDAVIERVARTLDLAHDPEFVAGPGLVGRLKRTVLGDEPDARPADPLAQAMFELRRRLSVQRDGKSFVVSVGMRSNTPDKAARIATRLVTEFIDELGNRRREVIVQARDTMMATLEGQRQRLAKAENAVEAYKRTHNIVDSDGRLLNTTRLAELNSQLLTARNASRTLAARLQQIEALRNLQGARDARPDAAEGVESSVLASLRTSRAEIGRQQETLRATLGSRHPQVVEIEAQVRSINRAIQQEIARLLTTAQSDYKAALAREKALSLDLAAMEANTAKTNASLVELRQLEREALAQRGVYEKFLARERELREQEPINGTNAGTVADAKSPTDPLGLRPPVLLLAALVLGLVLGTAAAVLFERLSGRVYSSGRLGARSGLPILGVLPISTPRHDQKGAVPSLLSSGRNPTTARVLYRISDAIEAAGGPDPAVMLVLSVSPGGVRSVISANIVLAEAKRGRNTLLIEDGSARRLGGRAGGVVSCSVDGYPMFSVAVTDRNRHGIVPGADLTTDLRAYDSMVIDGEWAGDEANLRRLAEPATCIVLVVESGVTRIGEVEALIASLARYEDKLLGLLVVEPGSDAAEPAQAELRVTSLSNVRSFA